MGKIEAGLIFGHNVKIPTKAHNKPLRVGIRTNPELLITGKNGLSVQS